MISSDIARFQAGKGNTMALQTKSAQNRPKTAGKGVFL